MRNNNFQNQNKDMILLLGGLGSRLRSMVNNVPKPMALINNKPFLEYLFRYWDQIGIERFHLLTGYKSEVIKNYFGDNFNGKQLIYYNETTRLGTGGAIKQFLNKIYTDTNKNFLILNGDTWLEINHKEFLRKIKKNKNKMIIAVRSVKYNDRYASLLIEKDIVKEITLPNFKEAVINGGLYSININDLKTHVDKIKEKAFSFEEIILPSFQSNNQLIASKCIEKFIDIGVPKDYLNAIDYISNLKI